MIMPNVAYFPIVYYAILRVGAIAVPMNPLLKAGEISFVWRDSAAKMAVVFPPFAEEAGKAASATGTDVIMTVPDEFEAALASTEPTQLIGEVTAADTAVILYTSGTTGQPKGAELTHANLSSNVRTTIETVLTMAPGDVVFGCRCSLFGQTVGLNSAMAGGASDPAAKVRWRAGVVDHFPRPRDDLPRRTDYVYGPARGQGQGEVRHVDAQSGGLGRSVAWTSDSTGHWARNWVPWRSLRLPRSSRGSRS